MNLSDGQTSGSCLLSLVIPAYNEAGRLPGSMTALREFCRARPEVEVVFVDDGSTDGTTEVAHRELVGVRVRFVRLTRNLGKGAALRAGVMAARGRSVVLMDADLSGDLADVDELVAGLDKADVVIGSRMVAGSRVTYGSKRRRTCSRIFNVLTCAMTGLNVSDTQCGFKAMRIGAARRLFGQARTSGFAIDVELLLLADLYGYSVREQAITWLEVEGSSVRLVRDSARMFRDIRRARHRVDVLRAADTATTVTAGATVPAVELIPQQAPGNHDAEPAEVIDLESVRAS